MLYEVQKHSETVKIDALSLEQYMGAKPEHFPMVQVKLSYDDQTLHVMFQVEDRYVRALSKNYQDQVCRDSCVEFFFTPGENLGHSYFNLEVNCGGMAHFCWHPENEEKVPVTLEDFKKIDLTHSLPKIVEPEIKEARSWSVEYKLPLSLIKKYCPEASMPSGEVVWKANFYKCADDSSQPHWLSWTFVDHPKPKFHLPEFFGSLKFI
jgi:hypothetical protein